MPVVGSDVVEGAVDAAFAGVLGVVVECGGMIVAGGVFAVICAQQLLAGWLNDHYFGVVLVQLQMY